MIIRNYLIYIEYSNHIAFLIDSDDESEDLIFDFTVGNAVRPEENINGGL